MLICNTFELGFATFFVRKNSNFHVKTPLSGKFRTFYLKEIIIVFFILTKVRKVPYIASEYKKYSFLL